jgi:nucleotidyltransferase/DNA polymerase involved in DNA repair
MLFDMSLLPRNNILCIDMKSFYASYECVDHGLDPLNDYVVVVADKNRRGSVVLAASPKMKSEYGIKTGNRLFIVAVEQEKERNEETAENKLTWRDIIVFLEAQGQMH